ncbi:hypothetical protein [Corynebacterium doosanense]|uniref:PBP domain-containing protein n=1 Tax=Corynebacterium doosanense CAU 212 = DSM 45436 TaxID=558173 RepID=A0A097IFV9_9CORY|nr:hypothetical protein [Corynebacterium doosanense]AIT61016.1 hypothetical protein CDOO_06930 [Corynebacterium doosanense CAU 212 = DSM 45436]
MSGEGTKNRSSGGRIVAGMMFLLVVAAAVVFGRDSNLVSLSPRLSGDEVVTGIIGSEKRSFFEDPEVREILSEHNIEVQFTTAGSRGIATDPRLAEVDFAFPSSAPAAQKIASEHDNQGVSTPFYSPMAVATFTPIMQLLEPSGVARRSGDHWVIDMAKYVEMTGQGTRWRDLGDSYPSPRAVQIATTDIRTSNSAAMYLAILSWVVGDASIAQTSDVPALVPEVAPLFTGQGYTESSSAGPFGDYLSQGVGSKPMVMVYEAQFLEQQMAQNSRINGDMTLAYLSPTTLSNHSVVAFSDGGSEVARLLREDPELQRLAAAHGFRTNDPAVFGATLQEHGVAEPPPLYDVVDTPSYEVLEELIQRVGDQYTSPDPPPDLEQDVQETP